MANLHSISFLEASDGEIYLQLTYLQKITSSLKVNFNYEGSLPLPRQEEKGNQEIDFNHQLFLEEVWKQAGLDEQKRKMVKKIEEKIEKSLWRQVQEKAVSESSGKSCQLLE